MLPYSLKHPSLFQIVQGSQYTNCNPDAAVLRAPPQSDAYVSTAPYDYVLDLPAFAVRCSCRRASATAIWLSGRLTRLARSLASSATARHCMGSRKRLQPGISICMGFIAHFLIHPRSPNLEAPRPRVRDCCPRPRLGLRVRHSPVGERRHQAGAAFSHAGRKRAALALYHGRSLADSMRLQERWLSG